MAYFWKVSITRCLCVFLSIGTPNSVKRNSHYEQLFSFEEKGVSPVPGSSYDTPLAPLWFFLRFFNGHKMKINLAKSENVVIFANEPKLLIECRMLTIR